MSDTVRGLSMDSQPTTLYRLYDAESRLLYVGIAAEWARRMVEHSKTKEWWDLVASVDVEFLQTRADALEAERHAILTGRPVYNVVHNRPPQTRHMDRMRHERMAYRGHFDWLCSWCGERVLVGTGGIYCRRTDKTWHARHAECRLEEDDPYAVVDVTAGLSIEDMRSARDVWHWHCTFSESGAWWYDENRFFAILNDARRAK